MKTSRGRLNSHFVEFIDTEPLPEKPSRRKIWELRKVRRNLRATGWPSGFSAISALTDEDSRALAWIGDEASLVYLSSTSNDPQTLAVVARKAMDLDQHSSISVRLAIAAHPAATAETLDFLSRDVWYGLSEELLKNPNTPDEALERMLDQIHASILMEPLMARGGISISLAVKASVKAHMFDVDTTHELKKVLCEKLEKPLGPIVWIEAARQIRLSECPDIDSLTLWAKKRTEKWNARTVAALEALQDSEGLDRETLCLSAEELAASKGPAERKGSPVEKSAQPGASQSI